MRVHVMYYGTMPGYQVTQHGGVALYPGDNYLDEKVAKELLEREIVRPALKAAVEKQERPRRTHADMGPKLKREE